jgi:hypothetical protein
MEVRDEIDLRDSSPDRILIGAQSYTATGLYPCSPPTSVTLSPQTIDALVTAVAGSGNYTVCTVQLAA